MVERLDELSIGGLIVSFVVYGLVCTYRGRPVDVGYLPRLLPLAGLPNILALLYGAFNPAFLVSACRVDPECLGWAIRLALAFGGLSLLALISHAVGLVRLEANIPPLSSR